ncbi:MAG TPA: hypothetical protein PKK99_11225, partial [Bacteroidia bacterium]|nr:hypothetical protein [Bacteroidia bacterium]
IQKSYEGGYENYENELYERLKKGELLSSDSIHFADSLKFKTPGGKIVYGGGGIMPDEFVALDTTGSSNYYGDVNSRGLINQFAYDYLDKNRKAFEKYKTFAEFNTSFSTNEEIFREFINYAQKNGVAPDEKGEKLSGNIIRVQIKALIARQIWKNDGFYPVVHTLDVALKKALDMVEKKQVAVKGD